MSTTATAPATRRGRTSAWRELCARVGFPAPTDPAPFSVERAPMRLDVCDEPMAAQSGWTIGVLESLPDGEELLHINTGVPWALLAMLETRGYLYRIDQREPGDVRIRIRRHGAPVSRWDERTR